jgi:hypothetical protein
MEEAVSRDWAAFSQGEALRRNIEWLDLVRSDELKRKLVPLVEAFERDAYRPASSIEETFSAAPTFCDVSRHALMLVDLTKPIRSVRHQCRFGHRGKHTTCRPAKNNSRSRECPYPPMTMRSGYVSAAYDRIVFETSILPMGMRSTVTFTP